MRQRDPADRRRAVLSAASNVQPRIATLLAPFVADVEALATQLSTTERLCVERFLSCLADLSERHAADLAAVLGRSLAEHSWSAAGSGSVARRHPRWASSRFRW
jgi:hypothetical protein